MPNLNEIRLAPTFVHWLETSPAIIDDDALGVVEEWVDAYDAMRTYQQIYQATEFCRNTGRPIDGQWFTHRAVPQYMHVCSGWENTFGFPQNVRDMLSNLARSLDGHKEFIAVDKYAVAAYCSAYNNGIALAGLQILRPSHWKETGL